MGFEFTLITSKRHFIMSWLGGNADMTEDLAEFLSTPNVTVKHRLVTGIEID